MYPLPKETAIAISKSTLKLVKDYQEEIRAHSLEETIKLAIGWGRTYNRFGLVPQTELAEKQKNLDIRLERLEARNQYAVKTIVKILEKLGMEEEK